MFNSQFTLNSAPEALPDSVSNSHQQWESLKDLPLDDLIARAINGLVSLAINIAIAIAVFYVGRYIINKIYKVISGILLRRNVEASLSTFILSLVRMVLYFILVVTIVGILGLETSSFIAIFASAGVAIGMALSGTLQNFAGGVLILLLKPYRIGDYIEAQGYAGTVREIQIFHTIISTPDNKQIIIPNGGLSTGSVNNYSRADYRRVDWTVGISYGDSVDVARSAILAMLAEEPAVLRKPLEGSTAVTPVSVADPTPEVFVSSLADSAVQLTVRAWCKNSDYWSLYFRINERLYKELPAVGINFPFPQLDVHLSANNK